jgi:hypothetical protein
MSPSAIVLMPGTGGAMNLIDNHIATAMTAERAMNAEPNLRSRRQPDGERGCGASISSMDAS